MDVSYQAGGRVKTARCEKIGRRWESFDGVTQRSHEPPYGLAKEFIILDDRDQWRFGQSALRHRARSPLYGRFKSLMLEESRRDKPGPAKLWFSPFRGGRVYFCD
jgi:hypothetical protein